ncbi:MAG: YqgE/AlgH family protein [Ectothiorhodospiraceae bacterium]|nr:YqgE/AlgH family protein [Ectothiorhodospiraceae bacterium]
MSESSSLSNHFLIAMPSLDDPNFQRTVTFLCEHNSEGALGIVINRPTDITLGELLDHLDTPAEHPDIAARTVYMGGPVQRERGFVLHPPGGAWDSSLVISERIAVTTSRDILAAIARGEGPERFLVALGYAGWGAGQLEQEMAANAWLNGPADPDIIFHHGNEQRWHAAAALLGVDINLLSSDTGHA